ncbi:hypothetical protein DCO48_08070 [Pseudomonas sp. SDI]|uniref:RHS repeat-associated core domain-containing protein n=1 Tax=Pseudomonas sp. SDI TaxID=2170734 RepID=UPI000DE6C1B9|nr:RHS repeat-associated core domain-containing protein [Pseudomonas sp. SDI]PWB33925.1 hypothetical protein DCO48_08070 [Pseudomonas sp. SDI]
MSVTLGPLLCRNRYDSLDRLVAVLRPGRAVMQRFHCGARAVSESDGETRRSLFQHDGRALAQRRHWAAAWETAVLGSDRQMSVLGSVESMAARTFAYTPYGLRRAQSAAEALPGFNGECDEAVTGHYLLGNGYRAFMPTLMRFNSPDSWSPFGKGGLNTYAYVQGDPLNSRDPTGHFGLGMLDDLLRLIRPSARRSAALTEGAASASSAGRPAAGSGLRGRVRNLLGRNRQNGPPAYSRLDNTTFPAPERPPAYPHQVGNIGPPAYTMAPAARDPSVTAGLAQRLDAAEFILSSRRTEVDLMIRDGWDVPVSMEQRLWQAEHEVRTLRNDLGSLPTYDEAMFPGTLETRSPNVSTLSTPAKTTLAARDG